MYRCRPVLAVLLVLLVLPVSPARAQGRNRRANSWIQTPYGRVPNPVLSPEWRQSGGNPLIYQQRMQQKLRQYQQQQMTKQYQALQKQQQAFEKWYKDQKAKKEQGKPTDPAFDELLKQQEAQQAMTAAELAKQQARLDAIQRSKERRKELIKNRGKTTDDTPSPADDQPDAKPAAPTDPGSGTGKF